MSNVSNIDTTYQEASLPEPVGFTVSGFFYR